jgi:galactokinase
VRDHLLLIDCRSNEAEPVPFQNPDLSLLVANTRVHHPLSDGGYAARRNDTLTGLALIGKGSWRDVSAADVMAAREALGDRVFRRSRHVVGEIQRTLDFAAALRRGDYAALGPLMAASHNSLRDDFEVSCAELDLMVDLAQGLGPAAGVLGSRMTGGGFGGSTITLCETAKVAAIARHLHEHYLARTSIIPEIFATRPAGGAALVG